MESGGRVKVERGEGIVPYTGHRVSMAQISDTSGNVHCEAQNCDMSDNVDYMMEVTLENETNVKREIKTEPNGEPNDEGHVGWSSCDVGSQQADGPNTCRIKAEIEERKDFDISCDELCEDTSENLAAKESEIVKTEKAQFYNDPGGSETMAMYNSEIVKTEKSQFCNEKSGSETMAMYESKIVKTENKCRIKQQPPEQTDFIPTAYLPGDVDGSFHEHELGIGASGSEHAHSGLLKLEVDDPLWKGGSLHEETVQHKGHFTDNSRGLIIEPPSKMNEDSLQHGLMNTDMPTEMKKNCQTSSWETCHPTLVKLVRQNQGTGIHGTNQVGNLMSNITAIPTARNVTSSSNIVTDSALGVTVAGVQTIVNPVVRNRTSFSNVFGKSTTPEDTFMTINSPIVRSSNITISSTAPAAAVVNKNRIVKLVSRNQNSSSNFVSNVTVPFATATKASMPILAGGRQIFKVVPVATATTASMPRPAGGRQTVVPVATATTASMPTPAGGRQTVVPVATATTASMPTPAGGRQTVVPVAIATTASMPTPAGGRQTVVLVATATTASMPRPAGGRQTVVPVATATTANMPTPAGGRQTVVLVATATTASVPTRAGGRQTVVPVATATTASIPTRAGGRQTVVPVAAATTISMPTPAGGHQILKVGTATTAPMPRPGGHRTLKVGTATTAPMPRPGGHRTLKVGTATTISMPNPAGGHQILKVGTATTVSMPTPAGGCQILKVVPVATATTASMPKLADGRQTLKLVAGSLTSAILDSNKSAAISNTKGPRKTWNPKPWTSEGRRPFAPAVQKCVRPDKKQKSSLYKCKVCGQYVLSAEDLKMHMKKDHFEKYECRRDAYCGERFMLREDFVQHERGHMMIFDNQSCWYCNVQFSTRPSFIAHKCRYKFKNTFKCQQCGIMFEKKRFLQLHVRYSHTPQSECNFCDETITREELVEHERKHKGLYKCKHCVEHFGTKSKRLLHKNKLHSIFRSHNMFKCKYCDRRFKTCDKQLKHELEHQGEVGFKCKYCDERFVKKMCLRTHERSHFMYKCSVCSAWFLTTHQLSKHEQRHAFKCGFCEKTFSLKRNLKSHERNHVKERIKCGYCDEAFTSQEDCARHELDHQQESVARADEETSEACIDEAKSDDKETQRKEHTSPKKYFKCKYCQNNYASKVGLDRHERIHRKYREKLGRECPQCCKRFKSRQELRRHLADESRIKPFRCKYCSKSFHDEGYLFVHERTHVDQENLESTGNAQQEETCKHHNVEATYVCPTCGKGFFVKRALTAHLAVHGKRNHHCAYCEKSFKTKYALQGHEVIHSGKFRCRYCDKQFRKQVDLDVHERYHTEEKPFKCNRCDKAFKSAQCVARHFRNIHTDHAENKRVTCEVCKKTYKNMTYLIGHRRHAHPDIEPSDKLKCRYCDKEFVTKRRIQLETHERTHTGQRPFKCKVCEKTSTSKQCLNRHCKIHEKTTSNVV